MSTSYSWEGIRQVRATLLGARHVPERLCGGRVYLGRYIKCSTFISIDSIKHIAKVCRWYLLTRPYSTSIPCELQHISIAVGRQKQPKLNTSKSCDALELIIEILNYPPVHPDLKRVDEQITALGVINNTLSYGPHVNRKKPIDLNQCRRFASWFQVTEWIIRLCRSCIVPRNRSQPSPCAPSTTLSAQKNCLQFTYNLPMD